MSMGGEAVGKRGGVTIQKMVEQKGGSGGLF